MFEALSGSSQSKNPRRPFAVLTAVALHAIAIGGFVLASATAPAIVEAQPPRIFPPHPGAGIRVGLLEGRKGPKKPPSTTNNPHRPTHMQPPREMVADRKPPDPIAPEPIAAPASANGNDSEPNPTNALSGTGGSGDAGDPSGDGPGSTCPPGATCSDLRGEQILSFNNALSRPHARCNPPSPGAPYAARQIGLDGRVVAQFIIHADGRADSVSVLNSDAPPVFAQAVREWVEGCTFEPAQLNGAPYSVRMTQVFRFESK